MFGLQRRTLAFCALALVASALFIRLGIWQLDRHRERAARNRVVAEAQRRPSVPFADLRADTGMSRYRLAHVEGRYDYEHEIVLASRTHQGSPGVELLTPVRIAGTDTAVLVDRGWVYSPDGTSVDRTRWHEGDVVRVDGYVEQFVPDADVARGASAAPRRRLVRRATLGAVQALLPYPVSDRYLLIVGDVGAAKPVRRGMPLIDSGPHRSYAFQWFAFATIALVGAAIVVHRERAGRREPVQRLPGRA